MKRGVFGGTFDPVHLGHLLLAEACRDALKLDEVRLLPAAEPPHKPDAEISPGKQRVAMLEFATAGIPEFVVDRRELKREGPSYTVDTLEELKQEFPDDELYLLIGADSVRDLPTWRAPERIATLARIVAVNRGDDELKDRETLRNLLGSELFDGIIHISMPGVAISATELRRRVKSGESIRFQTPRAVERYILESGLYRRETAS